ncbi:hypothetical protein V6N13_042550 [Hibiscus sabdariffa]
MATANPQPPPYTSVQEHPPVARICTFFKGLGITTDQKKTFMKALNVYYDVVTKLLQSEHVSLRQMERENEKILNAKAEFSEENASTYEKLQKSYDHLYCNVSS